MLTAPQVVVLIIPGAACSHSLALWVVWHMGAREPQAEVPAHKPQVEGLVIRPTSLPPAMVQWGLHLAQQPDVDAWAPK